LLNGKVAGIAAPGTVAVALNEPSVLFATRTGEVATPLELVGTVVGPWNDALGPEAGTPNVTWAFGTTFPPTSLTVACRRLGNGDPIGALCEPPPVAVMLKGAPGLLVRLKLAGTLTPAADTVTV